MGKSKFAMKLLNLLGDMVIEHEEYEQDTLTMFVNDVNAVVDGKTLDVYISESLKAEGFLEIKFSYGDGNWMTVHNQEQ